MGGGTSRDGVNGSFFIKKEPLTPSLLVPPIVFPGPTGF